MESSSRNLRRLIDTAAITEVILAYCDHFDRNQPAALAALFTADARVDYGPEADTLVGRDAILAGVARGLETTFAATSHHVSNVRVTFDDDARRATSDCYLYAWHRYRDGSPDGELWGRYHHRFARTEDGWRIAELTLTAAGSRHFHRATMHPLPREVTSAGQL